MLGNVLDRKQAERSVHLAGLRSFAQAKGLYEESVVEIYEAELERLNSTARITRYVGVLAEKRARDQLREAARKKSPATH